MGVMFYIVIPAKAGIHRILPILYILLGND